MGSGSKNYCICGQSPGVILKMLRLVTIIFFETWLKNGWKIKVVSISLRGRLKNEGLGEVKHEFPSPFSILSPPKAFDARPSRLRGPMPRNRAEKFMCQPSEILRTRTSRH